MTGHLACCCEREVEREDASKEDDVRRAKTGDRDEQGAGKLRERIHAVKEARARDIFEETCHFLLLDQRASFNNECIGVLVDDGAIMLFGFERALDRAAHLI